eukprot:CAMPEP_0206455864 /NCGR_PEP_ID=MMETSP0324_2-20121206/22028_1 /ASSEMBLY_ACC=CAM_ASM_000836 /TAXON_ID=2866 /ORGANISM="Crypthecodinium cohnii, Strain Seligo" /LENGTH=438 /DNA_ID=CAMNT_0053926693 /DNA_START=171 /DNA_END=1488 /DNA_ORIENTATION=-
MSQARPDQRNVRPRLSGSPSHASQQQQQQQQTQQQQPGGQRLGPGPGAGPGGTTNTNTNGGSSGAASQGPRGSPLIALMERAKAVGQVVCDTSGKVYTGFAPYKDLAVSQCQFVPMNSNRAINRDVVRQRVEENEDHFQKTRQYMEFGQINLIIVASDTTHEFLVMDGQHRCETMKELFSRHPDWPLWFQFRAKVVTSEAVAFEELRHFQRAYPSDPRSFFRSRLETRTATAVLGNLKEHYPKAFKEMVLSNRVGRSTGDPNRPYLNDNIVFWFLQDAGLLRAAADGGEEEVGSNPGNVNAVSILERLQAADQYLAVQPIQGLGKKASQSMKNEAEKLNCYLGFFRDGYLRWKDIESRLPPPRRPNPVSAPPAAAAAAAAPAPAPAPAPSGGGDCVVCLDRKAAMQCYHVGTDACARSVPPLCGVLLKGRPAVRSAKP